MSITEWLDEKEEKGRDTTHIEIPQEMLFEEDPDETVFYEEIRPCGLFCTKNHPFATVERYGHWYRARGRDKEAGRIHSSLAQWSLFTRDKARAVKTAQSHIQGDSG